MVTSQNGWPAGERADVDLTTVTVPGTKAKLPVKAGDVATVLLWVATRWHNEVEPLVEPGNWGYAYRAVRGETTGLSNHASGTAIDLNAPAHPLGIEPIATLSKAQVAAAKRIEADTNGVVRWGGSYSGRKDSMHWEINAGPAAVAALARRISGGATPAASEEDVMNAAQEAKLDRALEALEEGGGSTGRNNFSWLADQLQPQLKEIRDAVIGGNSGGRNNFHWLAQQIVAAAAPGAQVELVEQAIAKAVADEQDRRARDGDPATGPVS